MHGTWACAQYGAITMKRRWRHIGHGNRGRLLRCSPVLRGAYRYALGCRAVGDKDSLEIQAGMHMQAYIQVLHIHGLCSHISWSSRSRTQSKVFAYESCN